MSPFSAHYGYIRDKRSGVESDHYPVKKSQRYINLNPGRLFVQQPPKKEKGWRSSFKLLRKRLQQGGQLSHCKTKLNQIR